MVERNGHLIMCERTERQNDIIAVCIDQNGLDLTFAEYKLHGPMIFSKANVYERIMLTETFYAISRLPSITQLYQMYELKHRFPGHGDELLWSCKSHSMSATWVLYWHNGRQDYSFDYCVNYVRRVFCTNYKSLDAIGMIVDNPKYE